MVFRQPVQIIQEPVQGLEPEGRSEGGTGELSASRSR